jgi:hypothetical protein
MQIEFRRCSLDIAYIGTEESIATQKFIDTLEECGNTINRVASEIGSVLTSAFEQFTDTVTRLMGDENFRTAVKLAAESH